MKEDIAVILAIIIMLLGVCGLSISVFWMLGALPAGL